MGLVLFWQTPFNELSWLNMLNYWQLSQAVICVSFKMAEEILTEDDNGS